MLYEIDEMIKGFNWCGESAYLYIDAMIEVTDYEVTPAQDGIPYDGGANLPEPSYPAEYKATGYEFYRDVFITIETEEDSFEFAIMHCNPSNQEKFILSYVRDFIDREMMDDINEELNRIKGE